MGQTETESEIELLQRHWREYRHELATLESDIRQGRLRLTREMESIEKQLGLLRYAGAMDKISEHEPELGASLRAAIALFDNLPIGVFPRAVRSDIDRLAVELVDRARGLAAYLAEAVSMSEGT